MIIRSLKLKNFRQFAGNHLFKFGTGKSNVTIILGENGRGKTGIFRALMFVLYGTLKLNQDNPTRNNQLVNLELLDKNISMPVSAEVELEFEYQENKYVIKRSIKSIKTSNGKIDSHLISPDLYQITSKGDFVPLIKENPDDFINISFVNLS